MHGLEYRAFAIFTDFPAFAYFPMGKRKRRFFMPFAMGRGIFLLSMRLLSPKIFFLCQVMENAGNFSCLDITDMICNNCYATCVLYQFKERRIPYAACSQDNEGYDIEYGS